jgi:type II secretion system protein G
MRTTPAQRRARRGFTLVEMLVVITIIGILAGLAIPAVIVARNRAKIGAMVMDIKQLEMACQAYKEKFGEYPPDFAFVQPKDNPDGNTTRQTAAWQIVMRHLAKAFPRYVHNNDPPPYTNIQNDLNAVGVDTYSFTPRTALAFWLGGIPDPANHYLPSGFAADPTNPFKTPAQCASRIGPFFDFDPTRLKPISSVRQITQADLASGTAPPLAYLYWPQGINVDVTSGTDNFTGAIAYFRAENGANTVTYATAGGATSSDAKVQRDWPDPSNGNAGVWVYPAYDTRTSNATAVNWVNPGSVQIFSSGLDTRYGSVTPPTFPSTANTMLNTCLAFPAGGNYQPPTFDDITNFSGGKLEDSIP